ncbi:hypothetical protein CMMCAY01_11300 [Clavibacter michiganensis subsp. michiganensis]|nr:hypothetical protein CMMCAY01_11300 [Clavibacter michiganensis subsp. michiganensis]
MPTITTLTTSSATVTPSISARYFTSGRPSSVSCTRFIARPKAVT